MPNVVVLSASGYGNVPVPLLAGPENVEKTVPMDQRGLLANHAGSLFLAPRDMRKRLAESINRSFHPNENFVGRHASWEDFMAVSRVTSVPEEWGVVRFTSSTQHKWDWCQSTCVTLFRCYRSRLCLRSLATC